MKIKELIESMKRHMEIAGTFLDEVLNGDDKLPPHKNETLVEKLEATSKAHDEIKKIVARTNRD